ncbi:MAG TPA: hypothetical protein ENG87_05630 [Candidatus Pacearchaeota archaeon]|nr:hypothetical protein BMS3Abin17_01060 [archaeon BMS3Abin17]HDK42838.1 hypothetical protein [Candidatus Pacearchaeota archaeon]HDZ60743.1 hypothetical protein [Candidatus Pacearchaeota archaeon]
MGDIFYELKKKNVKKIKKVLKWAKENSKIIKVDVLDCSKSLRREKADKTFDEIFDLIDKKSVGFFVIILRKDVNVFGLFSDKFKKMDYLEIGIRSIDIGKKEYFIFIYLDKKKLEELRKVFEVSEVEDG